MSVVGVDGCRSGWIGVRLRGEAEFEAELLHYSAFSLLLEAVEDSTVLTVDMPIGLPEQIEAGGRLCEAAIRPLLAGRQSSVFSMPSRAAVYAEDYWEACRIAQATSRPSRKVSKQGFMLFPKVREIDALMMPGLESKIYEVHSELAFWRLNGGRAMSLPKKVKSRASGPGLDQRRDLLMSHGFTAAFLDQPLPKGCGRDDLIDASANALIALRLSKGQAEPFPKDYQRDGKGLRMAIWA
ncbi:DUF429 domain-containing protein [Roseibium litorale]|uniref:DUF429 domain-containing protein n=1 Tax=Roseibium litorale TaxID=2803841 RepID=A0ABR9CMH3_9HYPH|nr:DUF429 domain-containing protein [Roseibium litorale]MBD8892051.1 DUF429 domain-containing protein [Roseibium litorale]